MLKILIFDFKVLNYKISYFECEVFLSAQMEKPYWLNETYKSAIGAIDTGILNTNYTCVRRETNIFRLFEINNQSIVDYSGGCSIFVRLMRSIGFNAFWQDGYCQNLIAQGFEYDKNISKTKLGDGF